MSLFFLKNEILFTNNSNRVCGTLLYFIYQIFNFIQKFLNKIKNLYDKLYVKVSKIVPIILTK